MPFRAGSRVRRLGRAVGERERRAEDARAPERPPAGVARLLRVRLAGEPQADRVLVRRPASVPENRRGRRVVRERRADDQLITNTARAGPRVYPYDGIMASKLGETRRVARPQPMRVHAAMDPF